MMVRFKAWMMLVSLLMAITNGAKWCERWLHNLNVKILFYCLEHARKQIPDEFQEQLIECKESDPSCKQLGCWR